MSLEYLPSFTNNMSENQDQNSQNIYPPVVELNENCVDSLNEQKQLVKKSSGTSFIQTVYNFLQVGSIATHFMLGSSYFYNYYCSNARDDHKTFAPVLNVLSIATSAIAWMCPEIKEHQTNKELNAPYIVLFNNFYPESVARFFHGCYFRQLYGVGHFVVGAQALMCYSFSEIPFIQLIKAIISLPGKISISFKDDQENTD